MFKHNGTRIRLIILTVALSAVFMIPSVYTETPPALVIPGSANDKTTDVIKGRFVKTTGGTASLVYPFTASVFLKEGSAIFKEFFVRRGQEVKAGDPLISFTREPQTVWLESLSLSFTRETEAMREEKRRRETAIDEAREALGAVTDAYDQAIAKLRVDQMAAELQKYILSQQRNIDRIGRELDGLERYLHETTLLSPIDGIVERVTYKPAGSTLYAGEEMVVITDTRKALLKIADHYGTFRYGMEVEVTHGARNNPVSFTTSVVSACNILPYTLHMTEVYARVDDPAPLETARAISAAAETVALDGVLIVNRNALKMQGGTYFTRIVEGDRVKKRFVLVSSHRFTEFWVLQGLSEGQTVIIN